MLIPPTCRGACPPVDLTLFLYLLGFVGVFVVAWAALGALAWLVCQMRWGWSKDLREDFAILPHFLWLGPLSINILIKEWH